MDSEDCDPTNRRNVEIFTDFSGREPEGKRRRIVLRFLRSPVEIKGDGRVESVVLGRNRLERYEDGRVSAVDTGEREEIECGLVFRSIGYKGVGLDGLPFDEGRGVIPNEDGRVIDPETGEQVPGQYVVGWIKRGPSRRDRHQQEGRPGHGRGLLEDLDAGRMPEPAGDASPEAVEALLAERAPDFVTFDGWRRSTAPRSPVASRSAARA